MTHFPICFSADDNYAPHLATAIASILKTNPRHQFNFYVLDGGISSDNREKIKQMTNMHPFEIDFIPMRIEDFKDCPVPPDSHFSKAIFFRWKILSLFPRLDKILYLDCDLIVLKDLAPLFHTDMGDKWLAMTPDYFSDRIALERGIYDRPYYNSGVLLFNLTACRKVRLEQKLFKAVQTAKNIPYGDQDILNDIAGSHVLSLEGKYNTQFHPFIEGLGDHILNHISDVVILHFTSGIKPWKEKIYHPLNDYYFKYLGYTPWAKGKRKMTFKKIQKFIINYIKTDKSKKWKLLGITVFKKKRKQDYSRKLYLLGIPIWKTSADKWHLKYDQLLAEQALYKTDVERIKAQLSHLEAIKLLHKGKK